jgi:hypothetical protein
MLTPRRDSQQMPVDRPHVQIDRTNLAGDLRQHLAGVLPRLKSLPGVVGLTLNGGLSRGFADHLSEVDVTVYLRPETFSEWHVGKAPVPIGITILSGVLYDIKVVDFEAEKDRSWDNVDLWDTSYAELLFDPDGALARLFSEKLAAPRTVDEAGGLLFSCWWHFRLAGDIWIHRGDVLQGHHNFHPAVTALVQAVFVANQEFIPHEKWLMHMSRTLEWTPVNWPTRLSAAMATGDMTVASLQARQTVIEELWNEVDAYVIERYHPNLPVRVMQKTVYDQLSLLAQNGTMTCAEWGSATGAGVPNGDPFYNIITVSDGSLSLDREKLLKMQPDGMYSWHYEVLAAVRQDIAAGS